MPERARVVVCRVEEIPPGTARIVAGGRFGIGVFNVNGDLYALNNYCPHAGAPVCAGEVAGTTVAAGGYRLRIERRDEILRCPWHGWEFDIATGASLTRPVRRIKTFPVTVEDGHVVVEVGGRGEATLVIDALVHPQARRNDDLRRYLDEPWRTRPIPPPDRYFYPVPGGRFMDGAGSGPEPPGSDPARLLQHMDANGADLAVLVPLTRGLLPDLDLGSAVCAATNRWLAETWLGEWNAAGRFRGSIRVNPADAGAAVREIEAWAGHPQMVQVAVPMQAHHPYGQRLYHPVWEAAAGHGLPVAVAADGGSGVDLFPTAAGYVRHHVEYSTLYPLNFAFHLASLIAEGVFARLPRMRVVFTDGGIDMVMPLVWRMDKDWRATRPETPWVEQQPSAYLRRHVRFVTRRLEGPEAASASVPLAAVADHAHLLMYGSRYPDWDHQTASDAASRLAPEATAAVLGTTAADLYRLPAPPAANRRAGAP